MIFIMKQLLFLSFATLFLFSCNKQVAYEAAFARSERIFNQFKHQSNNSYTFVLTTHSWTNFSSETTLHVKNGKVTGRNYVAKNARHVNGEWQFEIVKQYNETAANINSHTEGFKAITLDEIYDKAKNEILKVDRKANTIYFEAKNNGMISSVGYVPKECADDCFIGYTVSRIEPID